MPVLADSVARVLDRADDSDRALVPVLALVAAAVVMGAVFAWERRTTGTVLAPAVTHLTWTTLMITLLPR